MKVLLLNGSCHMGGCTFTALDVIAKELEKEGVQTEIFQIGAKPIADCVGCGGCAGKGLCVFEDGVTNEFIKKAEAADGIVISSPVYFAHPDGRVQCLLDRAFYAGRKSFEHKPCAIVASARRAGTTASLDALAKYPTISQMPVVSSTYWCMVHGNSPSEVLKDKEGLQTMRNLAKNMAWLLKCIEAGKERGITPPVPETGEKTNFIR